MSQLGKQIRKLFIREADFPTLFPGDMHPDLASPGTPMPYIVVTQSENVVNYDINGLESHIVETMTMMLVCHTRAEAENRLDWVRKQLRPPSWKAVPLDSATSEYTINYWRLDSFTDGLDVAVEGDDSAIRTVSCTVTGSFKYALAAPPADNSGGNPPANGGGDFDGDGLEP